MEEKWENYVMYGHQSFMKRLLFKKVRLQIQRNLEFKVLDTYYLYNTDNDTSEITLIMRSYAPNKQLAEEKIKNSNNLLSFLYELPIRFKGGGINFSEEEEELHFNPIIKGQNLKNIYEVCDKIKEFSFDKLESFYDALDCYYSGLEFEDNGLVNESLLTRFRIFECIGVHYFKDINVNNLHIDFRKEYNYFVNALVKNALNKIQNTAYYKIIYVLNRFNINCDAGFIKDIVSIRNGLTHMKKYNYDTEEVRRLNYYCDDISKELMYKYFLGRTYKLNKVANYFI